jgi:toxin ParE1/3/4
MAAHYILSPRALQNLVGIWNYIAEQSNVLAADRAESAIRKRMAFLAEYPGAGHRREDLTNENVRFFPVSSYLIVYSADTKPLQIASIIHAGRDVAQVLKERT